MKMVNIEKLENVIEQRLDEIRNKDDKTLNEREEYKEKQELLRQISKIKILAKRLESEMK